jgi:hypothetical protein
LKLNGTHQILVNAEGVNIFNNAEYYKENRGSLIIAREETGLQVNARKIMYMDIFDIRMQDAVTI